MGRHGTSGPTAPPGDPAASGGPGETTPRRARLRSSLRGFAEHLVLGAVAGAAAVLVLAWAGTSWRTAALLGALTGCLVLVAARLAATVPGAPGEADGTTGEPDARTDPGRR